VANISELIQQSAGTYGKMPIQVMLCEVTGVSASLRTCTVQPLTDNLSPFAANLMTEIEDGVLIVPTKGSTVLVMLSEIITPTVIQYSNIDEILIVSGGAAMKIYNSGVELQGVDFGGLMKVTPSVKAWNDLQNDVNTLKGLISAQIATAASYAASPIVTGAQVSALFSPLTAYSALPLPLTIETQIENPKVKHGGGI
jgi:hypothetical protein